MRNRRRPTAAGQTFFHLAVHHSKVGRSITPASRIAPQHPARPRAAAADRESAWLRGAMLTP